MLSWFKRKNDLTRVRDDALRGLRLPVFRSNVLAVMSKLRDLDAPLGDVGEMLARDPGLSAKLLQLANSPIYGLRHAVSSVNHAVSMLGRGEVETMVIGVGVGEQLPREPKGGFEPVRYWKTAARRAATARAFAGELHPESKSEAFTAGLLQDMAIPFLAQARGTQYGAVLDRWRAGEGELAELEEGAFGWTHALVAGAIAESWGFPQELVDAIGSHHDGWDDDSGEAPALPSLCLASLIEERDDDAVPSDLVVETAYERCSMSRERAAVVLDAALVEADSLVGAFL